ncbi:MAG: hypothetical protein ACKPIC_06235, partial [Microcystis panniformis]
MRETWLYNSSVTNASLIAKSNHTLDDIKGTLSDASRAIIVKKGNFDDYKDNKTQLFSAKLEAVFIAESPDKVLDTARQILDANPGLGLTGPANRTPNSLVRYDINDPRATGTGIHDITSVSDEINRKKFGQAFVDQNSENKGVWGNSTDELSAIIMFGEALADKALEEGLNLIDIIPPDEEIFNVIGTRTLPITKIDELRGTVTRLGDVTSTLATKLAQQYGSKNLAGQIITQTATKTLGGYMGDTLAYQIKDYGSLPARVLYTRLYGNFTNTILGFGSSAISKAFNEQFDIEDPLAQIGVNAVISQLTNQAFSALAITSFGKDFSVQYLGVDPNVNISLSLTTLKNQIIDVGYSSLQGFIGSQLFNYLDKVWT